MISYNILRLTVYSVVCVCVVSVKQVNTLSIRHLLYIKRISVNRELRIEFHRTKGAPLHWWYLQGADNKNIQDLINIWMLSTRSNTDQCLVIDDKA